MGYKKITFVLPSMNDNRVVKLVIAGNNEFRLHGGAELDLSFDEGEDSSVALRHGLSELENKEIPYICYGESVDGGLELISSNLPIFVPKE